MVTAERFAKGMTFDQYVAYTATPENSSVSSPGPPQGLERISLRKGYVAASSRRGAADRRGSGDLRGRPGQGPVISRMVVRLPPRRPRGRQGRRPGRPGAPHLRPRRPAVQPRTASTRPIPQRRSHEPVPEPQERADVSVDPDRGVLHAPMEPLYHYTEYPAIFHKDRVVGSIRAPRGGETQEQAQERGNRDFMELQGSPFFRVWASAGVDEMAEHAPRAAAGGVAGVSDPA